MRNILIKGIKLTNRDEKSGRVQMILHGTCVTNLSPFITSVLKYININRLVESHLKAHENNLLQQIPQKLTVA